MIPPGTPYRRLDLLNGEVSLTTACVAPPRAETKVVIRVRTVGVCRSDLREIRGERHGRRDFGHEIVGEIASCHPDQSFQIGSRIIYDPHPSVERSTGFAELVELEGSREAVKSALVQVPPDVSSDAAVFGEPLACAVHGVRRLMLVSKRLGLDESPVAIVGAGITGTLMGMLLDSLTIPVLIYNRSPDRIRFLRKRGILTGSLQEDLPAHHRFRRVLLTTASVRGWALQSAFSLLSHSGVLLVFGGTEPGLCYRGVDLDAVRREEKTASVALRDGTGYVAGSYGAEGPDFAESIRLLSSGVPGSLADTVVRLLVGRVSLVEAPRLLRKQATTGVLIGKSVIDIDLQTAERAAPGVSATRR